MSRGRHAAAVQAADPAGTSAEPADQAALDTIIAAWMVDGRELRHRWQGPFTHLCVDDFQDVDAVQLRFVQQLAEPEQP